MIRYTLRCSNEHSFESWFASGAAYDTVHRAGMVACPDCGDTTVEKAMMAPQLRSPQLRPLAPKDDPATETLRKLRRQIESNSEDVGLRFAAEARAIHDGESPARAIIGQAKPEEARKLIQDGIPVAPLPFIPRRNTN